MAGGCGHGRNSADSRGEIPPDSATPSARFPGTASVSPSPAGRQYEGVVNYFDGLRDEIIFLCENGARVVWRGEDIFLSEVPFPKLSEPAELIRSIPNAYPLICGTGAAGSKATTPSCSKTPPFIINGSKSFRMSSRPRSTTGSARSRPSTPTARNPTATRRSAASKTDSGSRSPRDAGWTS